MQAGETCRIQNLDKHGRFFDREWAHHALIVFGNVIRMKRCPDCNRLCPNDFLTCSCGANFTESAVWPSRRESHRPPPVFGIAAWILPLITLLIGLALIRNAEATQRATNWFAGLEEACITAVIFVVLQFICSLISVLRRERLIGIGLIPLLFSSGLILLLGLILVLENMGNS